MLVYFLALTGLFMLLFMMWLSYEEPPNNGRPPDDIDPPPLPDEPTPTPTVPSHLLDIGFQPAKAKANADAAARFSPQKEPEPVLQ